MVTHRSTGSKAQTFKTSYNTYLKTFGTKVTLRKYTETFDSMNRLTGRTSSDTIIECDIQWVSKRDLQHLNVGDVQVGDGLLFTKVDDNISIEDEIIYKDKTWRMVEQVEGEEVAGEVVYKGYIIRKNAAISS